MPEESSGKKEPQINTPLKDKDDNVGQTGNTKMSDVVSINPSEIIIKEEQKHNALPDANLESLVDCKQFKTVNTVSSLMSWSDYQQKKVVAAGGTNTDESSRACYKAIDYRSMAHCKEPDNMSIRQSLFETILFVRLLV